MKYPCMVKYKGVYYMAGEEVPNDVNEGVGECVSPLVEKTGDIETKTVAEPKNKGSRPRKGK